MPYLGNTPSTSFATIVKDTFNGGSTGYTLSKVATTNSVSVFVENVRQEPTTAYSVSGTTLTFTATTPSGTGNIYVLHMNPTTTTTHPAAQNLTAVDGTFTGDVSVGDDLSLASDSAVLSFGADSDVTITHDPDDGLIFKSTATADDNPLLLTLQTGETDLAANDVIGKIAFQAPDEGTGTDAILVSGAIQAIAEGDHSASSNATSLQFMTGASEAATTKMTLTSAGRLGVGLTDPSDLFEVSNSADTPTRAIVTAEDSSGSAQNAFIKTKAKGSYYNGLELASTDGHVGFWGGYYSGSATMQARVGGSGVNSSDVQAIVIDSNGHVTMPNQSAFLAYLSTEDENLTQGGAENKLPFQTERFDLNADYNTSTYTFTAPVAGKYQFNVSIRLDDMASNTTYNYTYFKTSNRTYTFWLASPADWNGSAFYSVNGSILADLDANDTCYIGYIGQGGTDQADHADGYFSGHLVA
tara:strand:- start:108 stop:1517 length:1410 start_codon:yes stop_codon:yes gene_type:complete